MKILEIDATGWSVPLDVYEALFEKIGVPDYWARSNINALLEAMFWHADQTETPGPYLIRIIGTKGLSPYAMQEVDYVAAATKNTRAEFRLRKGVDRDVRMEILP